MLHSAALMVPSVVHRGQAEEITSHKPLLNSKKHMRYLSATQQGQQKKNSYWKRQYEILPKWKWEEKMKHGQGTDWPNRTQTNVHFGCLCGSERGHVTGSELRHISALKSWTVFPSSHVTRKPIVAITTVSEIASVSAFWLGWFIYLESIHFHVDVMELGRHSESQFQGWGLQSHDCCVWNLYVLPMSYGFPPAVQRDAVRLTDISKSNCIITALSSFWWRGSPQAAPLPCAALDFLQVVRWWMFWSSEGNIKTKFFSECKYKSL